MSLNSGKKTILAINMLLSIPLMTNGQPNKNPLALDQIKPVEELRKFIEANPKSTMKAVVDFANKRLSDGIGLPLSFYSLDATGGAIPVGEVKTPEGNPLSFAESTEKDNCGRKSYYAIASQVTTNSLKVRVGGKTVAIKMPATFVPAIHVLLDKNGKESFRVASSNVNFPQGVSADGKSVLFYFWLGGQPSASLNSWWTSVAKEDPSLQTQPPRLTYTVDKEGKIKFIDQVKNLKRNFVSAADLPNRTRKMVFSYENGFKIEALNICPLNKSPGNSPQKGNGPQKANG